MAEASKKNMKLEVANLWKKYVFRFVPRQHEKVNVRQCSIFIIRVSSYEWYSNKNPWNCMLVSKKNKSKSVKMYKLKLMIFII